MALKLPGTNQRLEVSGLYLRAVEVLLGSDGVEDHDCEVRLLPLSQGSKTDSPEVLNSYRNVRAHAYIDRCRDESQGDEIRQVILWFDQEAFGYHRVFQVIIRDGTASIKIPDPTGPRIKLAENMHIV